MINLKYIKNQKFTKIKLVEILFYSFPLWFIVGNLAVSINTLLFICASIFLIQKNKLSYRFSPYNWLLIIFFLYFFFSTLIQFQIPGLLNNKIENISLESNPIFKSFILFRFLILIIIIDTLFFNKLLSLKKLFFSSLICTTFVSADVILQYITGQDLFGYNTFDRWNAGPFGDEKISGAYLKNFSFLSFFYVFSNLRTKNYFKSISIFIIILHLIGAFLSGNRMPFLLLIFGCFIIFLFIKNLRFIMFSSFVIFITLFFIIINNDEKYKNTYSSFFYMVNIFNIEKEQKKSEEIKTSEENKPDQTISDIPKKLVFLRHSGHNRIYRTAIAMWKEQPITGFGLKSFRIKCWEILIKDKERPQKTACGNHAHNYYLEILSEAGIIGITLLIIFFIIISKDIFYFLIRKFDEKKNRKKFICTINHFFCS